MDQENNNGYTNIETVQLTAKEMALKLRKDCMDNLAIAGIESNNINSKQITIWHAERIRETLGQAYTSRLTFLCQYWSEIIEELKKMPS